MHPKVYLETTILSYFTAWPSRDLITAAQQQLTQEWWQQRERFEVYISQLVIQEASGGDPQAAARRLELVQGVPVLPLTEDARLLAHALLEQGPLPPKAVGDALHIALAGTSGIDYLLTWNCTHLANAVFRPQIERVCRAHGFEPPIICTPVELMEG